MVAPRDLQVTAILCISTFYFSSGLLWELWPLLHSAEPAAPPHRGPLHPPSAAGLAHPHRCEAGAADVHEQVYLKCTQPACSSLSILILPIRCLPKGGPTRKDPPCNSVMTFMSLTRLSLHKVRAGGPIWYTVYLSESLYVLILLTCKNRIGHLPQCMQGIPV